LIVAESFHCECVYVVNNGVRREEGHGKKAVACSR